MDRGYTLTRLSPRPGNGRSEDQATSAQQAWPSSVSYTFWWFLAAAGIYAVQPVLERIL